MAAVEHGEAHDVGLVIHHIIQPQQGEVLKSQRRRRVRKGGEERHGGGGGGEGEAEGECECECE